MSNHLTRREKSAACRANPETAAARGMAFEALDQLALEHLYGVRG